MQWPLTSQLHGSVSQREQLFFSLRIKLHANESLLIFTEFSLPKNHINGGQVKKSQLIQKPEKIPWAAFWKKHYKSERKKEC
jgi:hypothetical protein